MSKAQFVSTDDYINVNTNYFTTGTLSATNEQKYLISSMRIADKLSYTFKTNTGSNFSQTTWNGFMIAKGSHDSGYINSNANCTFKLWGFIDLKPINLVFIRPNDTKLRRCIMLTNGVLEDFSNQWTGTLSIASDLVMRGYAVLIYENFASARGLTGSCSNYPYKTDGNEIDNFRKGVYSGVQCGVAALQVLTNPGSASFFNIDTSRIYAMGASFGGIASVAFANADDTSAIGNVNYNNALFNSMGNFTRLSLFPTAPYRNMIKAVACYGGGVIINDPVVGNIFDSNDAPIIFFHAFRDSLCTVDSSLNLKSPSDGRNIVARNNLIGGPAKLGVIQSLVNSNIKYNVYINCDDYGCHSFGSGYSQANPSEFSYESIKNLSNTQILNLYTNPTSNAINTATWKRYMYIGFQYLDFVKYSCEFFNKATYNINTINSESKFVVPTTKRNYTYDSNKDFFPPVNNISNLYPNGRYKNIPKFPESCDPACIDIPLTPEVPLYPINQTSRKSNDSKNTTNTNTFISTKEDVTIYPIPSKDITNISFNINNEENISLQLVDLSGKVIYEIYDGVILESGNYVNSINTINFPNGIYFLTGNIGGKHIAQSFSIIK